MPCRSKTLLSSFVSRFSPRLRLLGSARRRRLARRYYFERGRTERLDVIAIRPDAEPDHRGVVRAHEEGIERVQAPPFQPGKAVWLSVMSSSNLRVASSSNFVRCTMRSVTGSSG